VASLASNTVVFDLAQELRDRSGVSVELVRKILDRAQEPQRQFSQSGDTSSDLIYGQASVLGELATALMAQGDLSAEAMLPEICSADVPPTSPTVPPGSA
jgi:hypothetical protein